MSSCMECDLPPQKPQRRCYWHLLKKSGTDAEVAAAYERQNWDFETQGYEYIQEDLDNGEHCDDCDTAVPLWYMKTKKRCRGCQLIKDRNSRDRSTYGIEAGTRQQMYVLQDGKCYGCNRAQRFTGLAMHHNHQTNEPLFLSCQRCNQGAGQFNDDPIAMIRFGQGMLNPPFRQITGWSKDEDPDS